MLQFIKIQFAKTGRIIGATVEKYLLEKTRIIHQIPGEKNYHIFYQLLCGGPTELLHALELFQPQSAPGVTQASNLAHAYSETAASVELQDFLYLTNSPADVSDSLASPASAQAARTRRSLAASTEFNETCKCMASIGIDDSLQQEIFQLLSAVIQLGNVTFGVDDMDEQVRCDVS